VKKKTYCISLASKATKHYFHAQNEQWDATLTNTARSLRTSLHKIELRQAEQLLCFPQLKLIFTKPEVPGQAGP